MREQACDFQVMWQEELEHLCERASQVRHEVVVIAPYIKRSTFAVLLDAVPPGISCKVFARWTVRDVVYGATDISIWPLVDDRNRGGDSTSLHIVDSLHAKYYRFDETVLIGSANLTQRGMLQAGLPNLEILVPYSFTEADRVSFELHVSAAARLVTKDVYASWLKACGDILQPEQSLPVATFESSNQWFPQTRNPTDIARIIATPYYPQIPQEIAVSDVEFLRVPQGFGVEKSLALTSLAFSESDVVNRVRAWIGQSRRFGEVRQWVAHHYPEERDFTASTQTLYRWLTELLPDEFSVHVANHSEILSRRQRNAQTS
jgi:hypothetical protein